MEKQETEKTSDVPEDKTVIPQRAGYSLDEEWVQAYIEQFGSEPGFF